MTLTIFNGDNTKINNNETINTLFILMEYCNCTTKCSKQYNLKEIKMTCIFGVKYKHKAMIFKER